MRAGLVGAVLASTLATASFANSLTEAQRAQCVDQGRYFSGKAVWDMRDYYGTDKVFTYTLPNQSEAFAHCVKAKIDEIVGPLLLTDMKMTQNDNWEYSFRDNVPLTLKMRELLK